MISRWSLAALLVIGCAFAPLGGVEADVTVSPGGIGDALIFPFFDVIGSLNTLIAIDNTAGGATVALVRFRDSEGTDVRNFELCLPTNGTWTAAIFRDGPLTRVTSVSAFPIDGIPGPLDVSLAGNPGRGFMEVIGIRTGSPAEGTTVCTDPSLGGDVPNDALSGKTYFVKPDGPLPLVYGANAVALKDFALQKPPFPFFNPSVFLNQAVAIALINQGTTGFPFASTQSRFTTRYFVAPSFGAETQVVLSFVIGQGSAIFCIVGCDVPLTIRIRPFKEDGTPFPVIDLPPDTSLIRVITLTSSDIPNDAGTLQLEDVDGRVLPVVGFGINTTPTSAPGFFNVLFPIGIK